MLDEKQMNWDGQINNVKLALIKTCHIQLFEITCIKSATSQ